MRTPDNLEWHGHRGCRGLRPENSIPAFIEALDLGMDYLEMDVVVSNDEKVVIAHEPYMPANICRMPDGSAIDPEREKDLNLFKMDYAEIATFDCGQAHPNYTDQKSETTHRPLLTELFEISEQHCKLTERKANGYTIELKSHPDYDDIYHPAPAKFAELVLADVKMHNLQERCVLQSFDYRILRAIRERCPEIRISMLLANAFELQAELDLLGFVPEIIGPKFTLLTKELVEECHLAGLKVVPWTINEISDMKRAIEMGSDGIITDYPNRKSLIVD